MKAKLKTLFLISQKQSSLQQICNLKIQTLDDRREALCLSFAKKCLKNEKVKGLFPLKQSKHNMKLRRTNKFKTKRANTKRYANSEVPYMRRLLNKEWKKIQESLKT